jgi:hypothetical protein
MAERMVVVCDVCGEPASETVTFRAGNRNLLKDLCPKHLAELVDGARRPRPGRKPGSRNKAGTTAKPARRATRKAARKTTAKRRGRPRKARTAAAASVGAEETRA